MVLSLDDEAASQATLVGGKAAMLSRLRRAGFPVEDGVVVTVDCPDERLAEVVPLVAERLGLQHLAVRSSGVAEDGAVTSFAGMYTTVLDVSGPDALLEAAAKVRASGRTAQVAAYAPDVSDQVPAVLIQRMVAARSGGVAFSGNPLNGDTEEAWVGAVPGVGAALVEGTAMGEQWIVRGDTATCAGSETVLNHDTATAIAALARQVADWAGAPQDIEWALRDTGEIVLLQARPMTGLPRSEDNS